jgi:hypothetical protein
MTGIVVLASHQSVLAASADATQSVGVTIMSSATPSPVSGGPTPTPTCVQTMDAAGHAQERFRERSVIRVLLAAGCAADSERHIEVDVASTPRLLTFVNADDAGGFVTPPKRLPAAVVVGAHEVIVKTAARTYSAPIVVTSAVPAASGTVLGSSRAASRPLPHTGLDALRFLLIASALVAGGMGLIIGSRQRRPA